MCTTDVVMLSLILALEIAITNLLFEDALKMSLLSLWSWELVFSLFLYYTK